MGTVAAVIPAYNPGSFLERSLRSVLAQEGVDLDVIVVDDGSPQDITGTPGLDDPRVRLLRTENRGVSAARNLAVALSGAEYVAFLDQDDEWADPRKLALQVDAHERQPGAAFVHTGFVWALPDGEQDATRPGVVTYTSSLANRSYVCLSSLLVKRDRYVTVGGHDVSLAQQQDWDLVLRLLRIYGPAVAVDGPLVRYNVHGGNASGDYLRGAAEAAGVYRRHELAGRSDVHVRRAIAQGRKTVSDLYAHQAVDAARAAFRRHDWTSSARHIAEAGRRRPAVLGHAVWVAGAQRMRSRAT